MSRAVKPGVDRMSAWHAAFWTSGTVLYVPRNVAVEQPLYSLIGLATAQAMDGAHTLVILEEGASATLLEETASANETDAGLHVGSVELLVGPVRTFGTCNCKTGIVRRGTSPIRQVWSGRTHRCNGRWEVSERGWPTFIRT